MGIIDQMIAEFARTINGFISQEASTKSYNFTTKSLLLLDGNSNTPSNSFRIVQ